MWSRCPSFLRAGSPIFSSRAWSSARLLAGQGAFDVMSPGRVVGVPAAEEAEHGARKQHDEE